MSNKSGVSGDVIALPKGGGAVQGIGETFSPNLFTGTGTFSVPIGLPPGRNGLQPDLRLAYSSGSGNGAFGLGWSLSVPGVDRKTAKGVPRYREKSDDADEHDVFVLSGAEDLVAIGAAAEGVQEFRPRTEGLFARIERLRDPQNDAWLVRGQDGLVSVYGTPGARGADPAVVADPRDRSRICSWRLSQTADPFGNRIAYRYLRDGGEASPPRSDQIYLDTIEYVDYEKDGEARFLVSVRFVYEERSDAFSSYRTGFEVRTRLRCRRIEVRTHAEEPLLVRTYELSYLDDRVASGELTGSALPANGVSLLSRVGVIGHRGGDTQELAPLDFAYSEFEPGGREPATVAAVDDALPPRSLADDDFELVDLFGNGLPDIVQMNGSAVFWRNLGNGLFDRPQSMPEVPSGVRLEDPGVRFGDLNGNGRADLLVTDAVGYFPLSFAGRWSREGFVRYDRAPTFALQSPEIRMIDVDGDGVVDALHTGPAFTAFFNDPETGWDRVETIPRGPAEEFPDVNFSSPQVKLADMSGDGLQDIVLVRQGRVDYWPNLGHGKWDRRVTMAGSPDIDDPAAASGLGFDPARLMLGDVDGDGLADLVYVESRRVTIWMNRGGNGFAAPFTVENTPLLSEPDAVRLVDLNGTGTSGLLWTSDRTDPSAAHYHFLDLTGGAKPYLLNRMTNNMGAVTRVGYAPSTAAYLADEPEAGTRWRTPLPFPVQVVERVEVVDELSGGKLTTEYRYRHGYWDGAEREFRGFARVDQLDTETFERFNAPGLHGDGAAFAPVAEARFSPTTLTKTWFHSGPIGDEFGARFEADFSAEYWPDDPPKLERPPELAEFLASLGDDDRADALRSLRGSVLRTEHFALDGSPLEERPYTVSETLHGLREEALPADPSSRRRRIFFPHMLAQRTTRWERGTDPMTQFTFAEDYDEFAHPRRQTSIACPRGWRDLVDAPGQPYLATRTHTAYATPVDPEVHIRDRVAKVSVYEIHNDGRQKLLELKALPDGDALLELNAQTLNFYDGDAFLGRPFGEVGAHGVLVRSESLVLTEEILRQAYRSTGTVLDPPELPPYLAVDGALSQAEYPQEFLDLLPPLAGYTFHASDAEHARGYFVETARHQYDFHTPGSAARGLLEAIRDPFGGDTAIRYDPFGLLPVQVIDPVGLVTRVRYDLRALQPRQVTDPNENRTRFAYTPLGLLESTAVSGKASAAEGDTEEAPGTRFEYSLRAFENSPSDARQPVSVRTIQRVHHVRDRDIPSPERDETIETVEYSDGFGRLLQTRTQAEDVIFGDPLHGEQVLSADLAERQDDAFGRRRRAGESPNVVVSGWQIHDNKGRVVEQFEPFFDRGFGYASPEDRQLGQKVTMFYDPRGELIRTVNPDGSQKRVVPGVPGTIASPDRGDPEVFEPTPWEAYTYDANDNAGRTHGSGDSTHFDTPASIEVDALGRVVKAVERNGPDPTTDWFTTRSAHDIRGNLLTVTDALGREAFRYVYDLANEPLRIENLDAGVRRVVLDAAGGELERRDGKGALVVQAFDPLRRPVRMWARNDAGSPVTLRERRIYGDAGDPGQDPRERAASRAANRLGVIHEHYDEAGLLIYERYDFKDNVAEKTRRVIADAVLLDALAGGFRIDWGPPRGIDPATHAASLLDPFDYRTSATYDALGRTSTVLHPKDVDGRRPELRARYNRAGALERVELDGQVFVRHVAYNARGQRTLIALGNGVMTRYAYDPKTFRLARLRSERYTERDRASLAFERRGEALQDVVYDYDLAGNITAIRDRAPASGIPDTPLGADALDRAFTYDPLYRLRSATGRECAAPPSRPPWDDRPRCTDPTRTRPYAQHYAYDPLGNMERLGHVANGGSFTRRFEHVPGTNRLDSLAIGNGSRTTFAYRHDDNGNLVQENSERHFRWDHGDRLTAFRIQAGGAEPSVLATYLYDAAGQRVKKLVRKQGGDLDATVYIDEVFEHHRWKRADADRAENNHLHVLDDERRIALVRVGAAHPHDRGPAVQYRLGDHLGSGTVVVDADGGFVNREEFSPYGDTSFGSFARKRYRFTGKERDEESGLCYHGARYYSPGKARWMSADPARDRYPGWSPYCYSWDCPLAFNDPAGRQPMAAEQELHRAMADINQLSEAGETAAQELADFRSKFADIEAQGQKASDLVNRARSQASGQTSRPSRSGGRSLEAADQAVEAWVKAESKMKDLEAVARESGARLKGAQIYLERKGEKLLGEVSELRRETVAKELGQTKARVEKVVKEVQGALGEEIKRPVKYKPPKPPRGPGSGPPAARARTASRGRWFRLPWRGLSFVAKGLVTVAGPVSAGTAETEGEALGLSVFLMASTRVNLIATAATIAVLGGIELGKQQAKVKTETVNDMIGIGFSSY